MSEERNVIQMENFKAAEEAKKKLKDPAEQARQLATGKIGLSTPIKNGDDELSELNYDFSKITGWDYADAMDSDNTNTNIFRITAKQALSLFATAVAKATPGLAALGVKEQISLGDGMNAVRIATAFFVASTRAANKRILNA